MRQKLGNETGAMAAERHAGYDSLRAQAGNVLDNPKAYNAIFQVQDGCEAAAIQQSVIITRLGDLLRITQSIHGKRQEIIEEGVEFYRSETPKVWVSVFTKRGMESYLTIPEGEHHTRLTRRFVKVIGASLITVG